MTFNFLVCELILVQEIYMTILKMSFVFGLFTASAQLLAQPLSQGPITGTLSCRVTQVKGGFNSFIPPQAGDQILVDTSLSQIDVLEFSRADSLSSYIPLNRSLVKKIQPQLGEHMAVFKSNEGSSRIVLMVGRFWTGTNSIFSGNVQVVNTDDLSGLTDVENLDLSCEPI